MPPWRSPTALTFERSTPSVTSVWAISDERPVMITLAPIRPRRVDRLHEVVGDRRVDRRHAGDVDHDHLRAVGADPAQAAAR
jgi:hypothetical protein